MSILLCVLVIFVFFIDPALITEEIMFYWALFSIAEDQNVAANTKIAGAKEIVNLTFSSPMPPPWIPWKWCGVKIARTLKLLVATENASEDIWEL